MEDVRLFLLVSIGEALEKAPDENLRKLRSWLYELLEERSQADKEAIFDWHSLSSVELRTVIEKINSIEMERAGGTPLPISGELAAKISWICGFLDAELAAEFADLSEGELRQVRRAIARSLRRPGGSSALNTEGSDENQFLSASATPDDD